MLLGPALSPGSAASRWRTDVLRAERARERPVRRASTDKRRLRRVDVVPPRELEDQPGERRTAPADRRPRAMRADGRLERPCRDGPAVRPPVENEHRRARVVGLPPAKRGGRHEHAGPADVGARSNATRSTVAKPSSTDGGSSSRTVRICDVGSKQARLPRERAGARPAWAGARRGRAGARRG